MRRGRTKLRLGAAVTVLGVAALAAAGPARAEWLAGDLHVHTTFSHDSYGGPGDDNTGPGAAYTLGHSVESQFALARSRGLHYLAITDHDDIRSQADPGFGAGGVIPIGGYEKSLRGHAQMLGARRLYPKGDRSAAAVEAAASALRADGGVFQVNHPANESTSFPDSPDWQYLYDVRPDTVEAWNISRLYQPPFPSASSNDDAVRYWEGWLDRGLRIGATGGSDNHYLLTSPVQGVGQPTTWVWARERSERGVLEGLSEGRTYITHQPPAYGGPGVFLEADPGRDGAYEAMVGDVVAPGSPLRVRVTGATGSFLRVLSNGGRPAFPDVPIAQADFEHRFTLPPEATWVRAELFDPDGAEERNRACNELFGSQTTYCRNKLLVIAMTSAVYLGARGVPPGRPPTLPGLARLIGARGCVRRPFAAHVVGRAIERVDFSVDRRRVRSDRRPDRSGRFSARIDPRRLRPGRHRLSARVSFASSSGTRPRTLRRGFVVCARRRGLRRPGFAG